MKNRLDFIKTTVVGGIVFLIPAVIVVIALGKLFGALKLMANALAPLFGIESLVGGFILDLLAIIVIILLCFAAGLIAKRATAKRLFLEETRDESTHSHHYFRSYNIRGDESGNRSDTTKLKEKVNQPAERRRRRSGDREILLEIAA